jgi:hypothetical protein
MSEVTDERLAELIAGHGDKENWGYNPETVTALAELLTLRRQLREAATALDHSAEYWDTLLIHGTSGAANELRKAYKARAQILRALKESV